MAPNNVHWNANVRKVLSKQPGTRQPDDKASNLKEGNQVNDSTTFEKVNNEVTKATQLGSKKQDSIYGRK